MKANSNQKNDVSKTTRLPIYLTHFGYFPMNKDGQVGNVNAPINNEYIETEKKMILDSESSNMMSLQKKEKNNIALKNLERNKIPDNDGKNRNEKKISLTNEKQLSFNGPSSNSNNPANSNSNRRYNQVNDRVKQNFLIKKAVPSRNNNKANEVMVSDDNLSRGDLERDADRILAQELDQPDNSNDNFRSDNNIIRQRSNNNKINADEKRRLKLSQKQAANELFDEHSTDDNNQLDMNAGKKEEDRRLHQTFRIKKNKDRNVQIRKLEKGMEKDEEGHFVNTLDGNFGLANKKKKPNPYSRNEESDSVDKEDMIFQKADKGIIFI